MKKQRIVDLFTYHDPKGIDPNRFTQIREAAKFLAHAINENGGDEDEIEKSIHLLRQSVFYAIASIVLPKDEDATT